MPLPPLDSILTQLKSVERRKKPKILVVDDEPDNLDLLYRTFRRDFQVLKAESGIKALEILTAEGEVAVIISDQRMPEMKGTEFLSKTVPQFPDTVRIILTGFTDVEDLVEAINSGQVYKYITKPWDPNELKIVVQRATETYELLKQRLEDLQRARSQNLLIGTIVQAAQDCDSIELCLKVITKDFGDSFLADTCILRLVKGGKLTDIEGTYSASNLLINPLDQDPLVIKAIAEQEVQLWHSSLSDAPESEYYQNLNLQTHLLIPILHRHQLLAVLSLQWKQAYQLEQNELKLIHLLTGQIGLVLNGYSLD